MLKNIYYCNSASQAAGGHCSPSLDSLLAMSGIVVYHIGGDGLLQILYILRQEGVRLLLQE